MITATSQIDPARQLTTGPTSFMTERNGHEVRCGLCARELYVDDETYHYGTEAIDSGLETPYRCEVCAEFDDVAYAT